MRKYLANTTVSISASLPNGSYTRISFAPLSDGRSVFYTSDKDLQWALEHHHKFNKLFRMIEDTPDIKPKTSKKVRAKSSNDKTSAKTTENTISPALCETINDDVNGGDDTEDSIIDDKPEYTEVSVTDMDAAKDYLAEHFDIVRTKLKTEEDIRKTALSLGVIFKIL